MAWFAGRLHKYQDVSTAAVLLVPEVKQPDYYLDPQGPTNTVPLHEDGWYVSSDSVKKIVNAHSPLGIPVILVISVPDGNDYGLHAITVVGHRQSGKAIARRKNPNEIRWVAENIDQLYAHDDQWGPFARINFLDDVGLKTPWTDGHGSAWPTRVTNIIVPVYPKVRISYEDIEAIVIGIDTILSNFFFRGKIKNDLVWDIKIYFSESYKVKIKTEPISDEEKMRILIASLPKYIWVVNCYIGKIKILEAVFDATDVNNGMIGIELICYLADDLRKILYQFLKKSMNRTILKSDEAQRANLHYYDFLLAKLK